MVRYAVGTPHGGLISAKLGEFLSGKPADCPWIPELGGGGAIARQRNRIVTRFLNDYPTLDHLVMIDSDQEVPDSTIPLLINADQDLIAANVLERRFPFRVAGFWAVDFPPARVTLRDLPSDELAKLGALGCGCLLIHRRVLEKMTPPWFRLGEFESDLASEDLGFCVRAVKETGVQAYLHPEARVGHETSVVIWPGKSGQPMMTFPGRPNSWTIPIPTL